MSVAGKSITACLHTGRYTFRTSFIPAEFITTRFKFRVHFPLNFKDEILRLTPHFPYVEHLRRHYYGFRQFLVGSVTSNDLYIIICYM